MNPPKITEAAAEGLTSATEKIKDPGIRIIIYSSILIISGLVCALIYTNNGKNKISERELNGCQTELINLRKENDNLKTEVINGIKAENKRLADRERWQDSVTNAINKIKKKIP